MKDRYRGGEGGRRSARAAESHQQQAGQVGRGWGARSAARWCSAAATRGGRTATIRPNGAIPARLAWRGGRGRRGGAGDGLGWLRGGRKWRHSTAAGGGQGAQTRFRVRVGVEMGRGKERRRITASSSSSPRAAGVLASWVQGTGHRRHGAQGCDCGHSDEEQELAFYRKPPASIFLCVFLLN